MSRTDNHRAVFGEQAQRVLIPGRDHIVGTVLCMENDPGKQPNGTAGPFVLFPIKE